MTRPVLRSALSLVGLTGVVSGGLLLTSVFPAAADQACVTSDDLTTVTCSYSYTGDEQAFVVPDGVTSDAVTAVGTTGDREDGGPVGRAAAVPGTLSVTPGTTLHLTVGGAAGDGTCTDGGAAAPVEAVSSGDGVPAIDPMPSSGLRDCPSADGAVAPDVHLVGADRPGALQVGALDAAASGLVGAAVPEQADATGPSAADDVTVRVPREGADLPAAGPTGADTAPVPADGSSAGGAEAAAIVVAESVVVAEPAPVAESDPVVESGPVVAEPVVAEPVVAEPVVAEPVVVEPAPVVKPAPVVEPVVLAAAAALEEPPADAPLPLAVPAAAQVTAAVEAADPTVDPYPAPPIAETPVDTGSATVGAARVEAGASRPASGVGTAPAAGDRDPVLAGAEGGRVETAGSAVTSGVGPAPLLAAGDVAMIAVVVCGGVTLAVGIGVAVGVRRRPAD